MTADRARTSRTPVNPASGSSGYYQVYPDASGSPDLIDDGPDRGRQMMPRRLVVMGAVAEGATAMLVVQRADDVEVPIPIPWLAVGQSLGGDEGIAAKKLLPHTVTAVIRSADEADDPNITVTGTPDEARDFTITITDPGDGEDPSTIVFDWEATGSGSEGATGASPNGSGVAVLGGTGITITFDTPTLDPEFIYTDNSTFEFSVFVTTATNVMVCW